MTFLLVPGLSHLQLHMPARKDQELQTALVASTRFAGIQALMLMYEEEFSGAPLQKEKDFEECMEHFTVGKDFDALDDLYEALRLGYFE